MEVGEEGGRLYTPIATLPPPELLITRMGSHERHLNVSLIGRDKVKIQCPQTTTF